MSMAATTRARVGARLLVSLLVAAMTTLVAPTPSAAAPRAAHTPVVFVHGYNADPGVWGSLRADMKAAGYTDDELFSWGYDTDESVNETLSGQLAAYVAEVRARTGADRVDLVAHSFGSLVTRWYVKFGGGAPFVSHWASIAGPNHGTATAWACAAWSQGCRDMTPGSYVAKQLAAGDETPGSVSYATWWSNCDEVINPDNSVPLTGATNHPAGCVAHNDLLTDDGVSRGVRSFLAS